MERGRGILPVSDLIPVSGEVHGSQPLPQVLCFFFKLCSQHFLFHGLGILGLLIVWGGDLLLSANIRPFSLVCLCCLRAVLWKAVRWEAMGVVDGQ